MVNIINVFNNLIMFFSRRNFYTFSYTFLLFLTILILSCSNDTNKDDDSDIITVNKVYGDGSKYCAFTSLLKRGGIYYLAFREGDSHVSDGDYGIIRILYSKDAKQWNQYQTLRADNKDLRDPNLTITPDGHLLIICGARIHHPSGYYYTKSYYALENGNVFSEVQPLNFPPEIDGPFGCWLWKLTWRGGYGYGAAFYNDGVKDRLTLINTVDGINYNIVSDIIIDESINETSIQFLPSDEMIALVRSEHEGYICRSLYPYTEWSLKKTNIFLAGQDFIIHDNHLVCATRMITNIGERTALWFGDLDGNFQWAYILPSYGDNCDTAYSGIIVEKDRWLLSYYSKHQTEKTSIYLATIPKVNLPFYK